MIGDIVIQSAGLAGALMFIISYQMKSNKGLYTVQLLGSALFCFQFFLLGAVSGCFSLIVNMTRNAMLTRYNDWEWIRWKGWPVVISAVCAVITAVTWSGSLSLLPLVAMIGSTAGYWTNNAQKIRLSNLVCACPAWLIYDICVGSWGGIINESVALCSILVSNIPIWMERDGQSGFGLPEIKKFKLFRIRIPDTNRHRIPYKVRREPEYLYLFL